IRVKRGINLVNRDSLESDSFVVITMGSQEVYDKDTFTSHDKMGDAEINIKPFLEVQKMGFQEISDGTEIKRVKPSGDNCLSEDVRIVYSNGKLVQDMILKLKKCGKR
ncbi:hypothetical protein AALP_AA6G131800, partial [Arabis alpina]